MAGAKLPTIEAIKKFSGAVFEIQIGLSDADSLDKLNWLKNGRRDFLKVTSQLEKAMVKAFQKSIDKSGDELSDADFDKAIQAAGEGVLEHVAKRFVTNSDVRMRPLAPSTIKRKGHNKIGVDSGELFEDVVNGSVVVHRIK